MSLSDDQGEAAHKPLDVSLLKEIAVKSLVDALNSVNGVKTLVLDNSLSGPLGLVTEVSLLKHHGVDKMFWLESGPLKANTTNVVYLCRPHIQYIKIIAAHIKQHMQENQKHVYHLIMVPRDSTLAKQILEEEGVLGDVIISSYNLQFIPLAEDVISLENDKAFKELWVDGDETVVYESAQALLTLQKLYGGFPRIVGKGDYAARLSKFLTQARPSSSTAQDALLPSSNQIDSLVVVDRKVDMITPLLTQLTYEGLIDEIIGIKNSHVELPKSLVSPPTGNSNQSSSLPSTSSAPASALREESKKKYHLSEATDPLFASLRDLNFSAVGKKLSSVAHRLEEDYEARKQAKTVAQLRDFVGKLGNLQNEHQTLRLHTGLSELLVPVTRTEIFNKSLEIQQNLMASYDVPGQISAIESLIAQDADKQLVIRLLCLACITNGGIKTKALESIKREILQSYGYDLLPLLLSLESKQLSILHPLISSNSSIPRYPYQSLQKSLRLLIDDNPDALEEVENDISFVYSGYAPISIRLVQCVAQKGGVLSNPAIEKDKTGSDQADKNRSAMGKVQAHPIVGWKGFEDVIASIPGQTIDTVQDSSQTGVVLPASAAHSRQVMTTTVVFFLGGCTYTEVAALRWVSRQNIGRRFLIATTGIINGNGLVESLSGQERSVRTMTTF